MPPFRILLMLAAGIALLILTFSEPDAQRRTTDRILAAVCLGNLWVFYTWAVVMAFAVPEDLIP